VIVKVTQAKGSSSDKVEAAAVEVKDGIRQSLVLSRQSG